MCELFDRLLRFGTGGEGALAQPVLGNVGALPGFKVGIGLLDVGNHTLLHTTHSEHAAHRIRSPLAKHGGAKGGLEVLHLFCHERNKIKFGSYSAFKSGGLGDDVQSLEHLKNGTHPPSVTKRRTIPVKARTYDSITFRCAAGHKRRNICCRKFRLQFSASRSTPYPIVEA